MLNTEFLNTEFILLENMFSVTKLLVVEIAISLIFVNVTLTERAIK